MIRKLCSAVALLALSVPAFAHGGHGALGEVHWHATDTAGFIVVAALATIAILLSRGD